MLKGIAGDENFEVVETTEEDRVLLTINADPTLIGVIIGKGGKTIRSIRKIVSARATIEKKFVSVNIAEQGEQN